MTNLPPGSEGSPGPGRRASARLGPRPGTAVAASAPNSWSDPALVSVDRWLAQWPGVAGVSAMSWWGARAGGAGLLSALAFSAAGVHNAAIAAGAVACLAILTLLPGSRHAVHLALTAVALTGLVVTTSGAVALVRGHLTAPPLRPGPLWPSAASAGGVMVQVASTVVLLCLAAVCLLALAPATSRKARRQGAWFVQAAGGAAVGCWMFAVPLVLRLGGLNFAPVLLTGNASALRASLAVLLEPVAGPNAPVLVTWVLCGACGLGALGALSGATALAQGALGAAKVSLGGRHGPAGLAGAGLVLFATGSCGLVAGTVALLGPRGWLLVALGSLATGALALTLLAPPVLRQFRRPPGAVRVVVTATWVLFVTVAVGAAGPLALAIVGLGALAGAFTLGWRGLGKNRKSTWRPLGLPWGTAAVALVAATAVTTLEIVPTGVGPTSSDIWRGLAVVVMGAAIVLLAVFPATSRLRVERLASTASTLAEKTLPALASALEAIAMGDNGRVSMSELSDLKATTRRLEPELSGYGANDEMLALTKSLVDASNQVLRLASGIEAVARLDERRLEALVGEHTAALSHANRNLVDSQWRRGQLLDRTVRVAEGERARIAANLHDGPIQKLAAIGLILDRCRLRLDRDDKAGARELMKRARSELSDEIQDLREMMSELRPPILDEGGLDAALQDQLSSWTAATGVEARFDGGSHGELTANSETVIYRVVQEALANVAKHAQASLTTVSLRQTGSGVEVVVRDNGKGFDARNGGEMLGRGHFGLVVMRERVELASGRFDVNSAPRTGTELKVWLPTITNSEPIEAA